MAGALIGQTAGVAESAAAGSSASAKAQTGSAAFSAANIPPPGVFKSELDKSVLKDEQRPS